MPADPTATRPPAGPPHFVPAGVMINVTCVDGRLVDEWALVRLEELDDTIFGALEGDAEALDRAARLWRRIQRSTPAALVEESREQYVRRAEAVYRLHLEAPQVTLGRAFAALEILALMVE